MTGSQLLHPFITFVCDDITMTNAIFRAGALCALALALAVASTACGSPTTTGSTSTAVGATAPGSTPSTTVSPTTTAPTAVVEPPVTPTGKAETVAIHTSDGRDRTYHLYVPPTLPAGTAVPLLVALHGGTGWATQFETQSGFDGLAEANHFIVAYPDGIVIPSLGRGQVWNAGHCCGAAGQDAQNVDDVGFISMMIDQIEASHDIDRSRVFAAGHSNGAMMGIRLGCELSDKIVAVAVQSGTLELDQCHPGERVSLLEIHGTADKNVPIDGGRGTAGISQVDFKPPKTAITAFVNADECPAVPSTAADPTNPDVVTDTWSPCAAGTEVKWTKVTDATHAWMGHPANPGVAERGGAPYQKLDSSLVIWTFLVAHPRT